ncbi:hypothetical protein KIPB_014869, partial [Kipferlia bialata]|eukprot:g14869.t1
MMDLTETGVPLEVSTDAPLPLPASVSGLCTRADKALAQ